MTTHTSAQPTPGPWRIGDAGTTIFGPPNGKPCPEIVASLSNAPYSAQARANAAHIVHCVNTYPALVNALLNVQRHIRAKDYAYALETISRTISTAKRGEQS